MTVHTKYNIGDRVRVMGVGSVITIGQIRFQTLDAGKLLLIEYRQNYSTGRSGPWRPERALDAASDKLKKSARQ
jgi:hypothetical protein